MKLFNTEQIRRWDEATIARGIPSIQLMERAARALVPKILQLVTYRCSVAILAGPGNNGGDALALSRLLKDMGFENLHTYLVAPGFITLSENCQSNLERVDLTSRIEDEADLPEVQELSDMDLIIDGLFGSGLSRPLQGLYAECISRINKSDSQVISIDIPSGAYADKVVSGNPVAQADHVLSFQIPKRSFLHAESSEYMKAFELVDIHLDMEFHENEPCEYQYLEAKHIANPQRKKFSHKSEYGHGVLLAGSSGMYGAAQLSSKACLRSGIGLLTVHGPWEGMDIIQATVPEAIYSRDYSRDVISQIPIVNRYSAIACGPGIGTGEKTVVMIELLLAIAKVPLILDADALNIIADNNWQNEIPEGTIISPHPKEFQRLFGSTRSSAEAIELQRSKSKELGVVIIKKGAHTTVTLADGRVFYNSSGNQYMATAGMGDVLTGVLLGLRAQGLSADKAALTAVFQHGRAGDEARRRRNGGFILSGDVVESLRF